MDEKICAILDYFGPEHQIEKMCEECGELIQALMKYKLIGDTEENVFNVRGELADVLVMAKQLQIIFGDVSSVMDYKVSRTLCRIDGMRRDA